jgi:hypothetical protein
LKHIANGSISARNQKGYPLVWVALSSIRASLLWPARTTDPAGRAC